MNYYSAYSLRIQSEIPLLELPPSDSGGDVDIRLNPPKPLRGPRSLQWSDGPQARALFCYPGAGRFQVRGGNQVIVTPEPHAECALLRLYVQGMMLAAILHQRGRLVLHSSIVAAGERAIAFVGPMGAGKSTLASGFHARGYHVVADDNAAIDLQKTIPTVVPAFPSLKIYPAVAVALGYDDSALKLVHAAHAKHAQPITDRFHTAPVPLGEIYLLDRETDSEIQRLSPVETMTELIRHSVPTRWGATGDGAHLKMCAAVATRVPVFRVRTFQNLQEIHTVIDRILDHQGARR